MLGGGGGGDRLGGFGIHSYGFRGFLSSPLFDLVIIFWGAVNMYLANREQLRTGKYHVSQQATPTTPTFERASEQLSTVGICAVSHMNGLS